jgi:hypothetical protein
MDNNASLCHNEIKNERCIMKLRKDTKDMTGQIFGRLTVLNPSSKPNKRGMSWDCQCICGKKTIAYGGHLRAGKRISCGCIAQKNMYMSGVKFLYGTYKSKAKKRNIYFDLTLEEFQILISGNCFFCGSAPYQEIKSQHTGKSRIFYTGIDRVDNTIGYQIDNCVSCCKYCNYAKSDLTMQEFKNHIKRIYQWLLTDF